MNGLLLSHGEKTLTRQELSLIPTPEPTPTWRPVPHSLVADMAVDESQQRGWRIVSEDYGIGSEGSKMFGVLRFSPR